MTITNLRTINITQPVQSSNNDFQLMDGLPNVTDIHGLDKLNTSQVSMMAGMFADDYALKGLDLSHFDMSNVNNTNSMFAGDNSLHRLNISSFGSDYAMGNLFQGTGIDRLMVGPQTHLWGGQGLQYRSKWEAPDGSISNAPDGSHPDTWIKL